MENIDGEHLRPLVLAILLEPIEREILMDCYQIYQYFSPSKNCAIWYTIGLKRIVLF